MAGNRLGKTYSGAAEAAMHLTGRYPDWWDGRRFETPVNAWIAGENSKSVRDVVQSALFGKFDDPLQFGCGSIPKGAIVDTRNAPGFPLALDGGLVKHVSGGNSSVVFKTYEVKQAAWMGEKLHFVWFDEEPPLEIYIEGLTRTVDSNGLVYLTFTPLQGWSNVVQRFLGEENQQPEREHSA